MIDLSLHRRNRIEEHRITPSIPSSILIFNAKLIKIFDNMNIRFDAIEEPVKIYAKKTKNRFLRNFYSIGCVIIT